jgi:hypothetical protein
MKTRVQLNTHSYPILCAIDSSPTKRANLLSTASIRTGFQLSTRSSHCSVQLFDGVFVAMIYITL